MSAERKKAQTWGILQTNIVLAQSCQFYSIHRLVERMFSIYPRNSPLQLIRYQSTSIGTSTGAHIVQEKQRNASVNGVLVWRPSCSNRLAAVGVKDNNTFKRMYLQLLSTQAHEARTRIHTNILAKLHCCCGNTLEKWKIGESNRNDTHNIICIASVPILSIHLVSMNNFALHFDQIS